MKKLLCALAVALCWSCSSPAEDFDDTDAVKHGRADAQKVIEAKEGSLDRENALLNIRATEYKILQTGDTLTARAYISAAKSALDEAGIW